MKWVLILTLILLPNLASAFTCQDLRNREIQITKLHELDHKGLGINWAYNGMDDMSFAVAKDYIDDAYKGHMDDLKGMEMQMGCK